MKDKGDGCTRLYELVDHGVLRMIEFAVHISCGGESDDVGDANQ